MTVFDSDDRQSDAEERDSRSRAQKLCHAVGVDFLYHICYGIRHKGAAVPEEKKIAIRKDHWMASLAGAIHLIPVSASLTLIVLNCYGYYIGGELAGISGQDDAKFLGLQFAAKLHELTLNASLAAVILSYIRHEIVTSHGLPFGAMLAGLQFKDISYLWSMEFLGATQATFRRRRDKGALIMLIMVCAALAVSAGPSSATLMKPRLDYWPAGGTVFWVAKPKDDLWSTNVPSSEVHPGCTIDTGDLSCPYAGWQTIADNYMANWRSVQASGYLPDTIQMMGSRAVRTLRARQRSKEFQFSTSLTYATVATSSVADGLVETGRLWAFAVFNWRKQAAERFWSRKDVTYSVPSQQPIVHARCLQFNGSSYNEDVLKAYNISSGGVPVYDLWNEDGFDQDGDFGVRSVKYSIGDEVSSVITKANTSTVPYIAWATVPQFGGTALAAFVSLPLPRNGSKIFSCTTDARLAPVIMQSTRDVPTIVTGTPNGDTYSQGNTWPRFSIDSGWAAYLNPIIDSNNVTALQEVTKIAGLWNSSQPIDIEDAVYIIESFLSIIVANGLSRRDYGTRLSGTLWGDPDLLNVDTDHTIAMNCGDWCGHLLPSKKGSMGYGGVAFNLSGSEKMTSTKFTMQANANGWAYDSKGSAAKFAMAALIVYCIIAGYHWVYIICIEESSGSWDSISELVALAMRSSPSDAFENTGAGIDSAVLFKKPTQIIDMDGRLQLAVGAPSGRYATVRANKLYG